METVAITHIGRVRKNNEDSVLLACETMPRFMLVADGMGGHAAGEVASEAACKHLKEYIETLSGTKLTDDQIVDAVMYTNGKLLEITEADPKLKGMGTTLTFAYVDGNDLCIAQVGDSRAYHFNGTDIKKITKDHTYVQRLIDSGTLDEKEEAKHPLGNIITRALGMKKLKVDIFHLTWKQEDLLLLCSDGLTAYLDEPALSEVLRSELSLENKAQKLVDLALEAGGRDNISVVIARNTAEKERLNGTE